MFTASQVGKDGGGRELAVGKQGVDLSSATKSGGDKRRSPLCQQPVRWHNKSEEGVAGNGEGREGKEERVGRGGRCRECSSRSFAAAAVLRDGEGEGMRGEANSSRRFHEVLKWVLP